MMKVFKQQMLNLPQPSLAVEKYGALVLSTIPLEHQKIVKSNKKMKPITQKDMLKILSPITPMNLAKMIMDGVLNIIPMRPQTKLGDYQIFLMKLNVTSMKYGEYGLWHGPIHVKKLLNSWIISLKLDGSQQTNL